MNDPRITAYALGELTGQDREAFERDLAASEDLQSALNETTQMAESLGNLPMPTDTLPEEERGALRQECAKNLKTKRPLSISRILVIGGGLAAAACVIFSLSLPAITGSLSRSSPEMRTNIKARQSEAMTAAKQPTSSSDLYANLTESISDEAKQLTGAKDDRGAVTIDHSRVTVLAQQILVPAEELEMRSIDKVSTSPAQPVSAPITAGNQTGSVAISGNSADALRGETRERAALAGSSKALMGGDIPLAGRLFRSDGDLLADSAVTTVSGKRKAVRAEGELSASPRPDFNTETYDAIQENVFLEAKENPLSTFSIDVDTASYANVRRFLQNDQLPPAGAIRTEELINYFSYNYPQPESDVPFSVNLEVSRAPWDASRELVRIGLQGREIPSAERGPANLVFLVDVSGSMNQPDKLPLLKRSLQALVENLSSRDRVALVVYAGSSGLVLPSTPGTEKNRILSALENLQAGGGTNGASGIQLAYDTARKNFLQEGNNRVILCTDGDFNVGTTNQSELVRLIEKERNSGVFLSVLGFGTGNLKDSTMEKLADKGNGNYGYIDSLTEGRKVLVEQMGATLFTIAKDVKIQVEFNPARVAGYRLIGYENRLLAKEDFNDDKKDAGEIGSGHNVTALYEIIPAGQPLPDRPSVDPLKYQGGKGGEAERRTSNVEHSTSKEEANPPATDRAKPERPGFHSANRNPQSEELLTVKLRYKAPDGDKSQLIEVPLAAPEIPAFAEASPNFRFASAVAAFGMKLRGSPSAGDIGWSEIQSIVRGSLGEDPGSYRAEFLTLIEKASRLAPEDHPEEK